MTDHRLVARFALRESMGVAFMGVALFWPARTLSWWQGWTLLAITAAWALATGVVICRHHPALLAERLGPRRGTKGWDVALLSAYGVLQVTVLVVAGLDFRYGWSGGVVPVAQLAALAGCVLGFAIAVWAAGANAFFSQSARIQTERRHAVVTGGPYRYVRHPAYAGTLLAHLSAPILLGSRWALAIAAVAGVLLVVRTILEDHMLRAELDGYAEYASRVTRRLIPRLR